MNNPRWTAFAVSYQIVYAYMLGLIIYQVGTFLAGGGFGIGTIADFAALALLVFLFVRKPGKTTLPLTEGIRNAA
jgi:ferrous iron transport protein B